jgi:ABC transporter substrate binding protein
MTLERSCPHAARIDRRAALAWLSTFAAASRAQRAPRVPRVAYFSSRPGPNDFEEAFLRGMRELGWIDGQNIVLDFRWFNFDLERGKNLVSEALAARPDLAMLADSTGVRPLIKSLMPALPIVVPAMADPMSQGIASNFARPDNNITGISVLGTELSSKRLSLFKEALPSMRRAAALFNKNRLAGPPSGVSATVQAGKEIGVGEDDMHVRGYPSRTPAPGLAAGSSRGVGLRPTPLRVPANGCARSPTPDAATPRAVLPGRSHRRGRPNGCHPSRPSHRRARAHAGAG